MGFTFIAWMSLTLNVILLFIITILLKELFKVKKQAKNLVKELDSDSLEFYLKKIRSKGFDVTIKPGKK
jgi:hypothetical protein